jgi:hypothetical protein
VAVEQAKAAGYYKHSLGAQVAEVLEINTTCLVLQVLKDKDMLGAKVALELLEDLLLIRTQLVVVAVALVKLDNHVMDNLENLLKEAMEETV